MVPGTDLDAEDSLALSRWSTTASAGGPVLDVAVIALPRISNFGDIDPLRLEPSVSVRLVRTAAELGRPHLVVLPGSKATREDLAWLRASGLADAIGAGGAAVVAICAGLQMVGERIDDPDGVEGAPGAIDGLGWLPVVTRFLGTKVLDRPVGVAVAGPGQGATVAGYRIHHGRVEPSPDARSWLTIASGAPIGWWGDQVAGTSLHGLFESDDLRAGILRWAADRAGVPAPDLPGVRFGELRMARLDQIADTLEAHLDLERLVALIAEGAPDAT
jgi:adenosylcobyric acid synthase